MSHELRKDLEVYLSMRPKDVSRDEALVSLALIGLRDCLERQGVYTCSAHHGAAQEIPRDEYILIIAQYIRTALFPDPNGPPPAKLRRNPESGGTFN